MIHFWHMHKSIAAQNSGNVNSSDTPLSFYHTYMYLFNSFCDESFSWFWERVWIFIHLYYHVLDSFHPQNKPKPTNKPKICGLHVIFQTCQTRLWRMAAQYRLPILHGSWLSSGWTGVVMRISAICSCLFPTPIPRANFVFSSVIFPLTSCEKVHFFFIQVFLNT